MQACVSWRSRSYDFDEDGCSSAHAVLTDDDDYVFASDLHVYRCILAWCSGRGALSFSCKSCCEICLGHVLSQCETVIVFGLIHFVHRIKL